MARSSIVKVEPTRERAGRLGEQNLVRSRFAHDARYLVHGNSANVSADRLDLADMDSDTDLELACPLRHGGGAVKSVRRSVEGRKHPVTGGVDLSAAMVFQLSAGHLVM